MAPAHYIIFHPEWKRQAVKVRAKVVVDGKLKRWNGTIWIDGPPGNEDPFVFREPWLYSYCHATQLRRKPNKKTDHVQVGSVLIFCSGEAAESRTLVVDTVLVVGHVEPWTNGLPPRYRAERQRKSGAWRQHLVYGTNGSHTGKFTYEANGWARGVKRFSFLPLSRSGRVSVPFDALKSGIAKRIAKKCAGKWPVRLREHEMNAVLSKLMARSVHRVVGPISFVRAVGS